MSEQFLSSLSTLLLGFLCFPATTLMCRILQLDEEDTKIMQFVCLPTTAFLIILGFLGVFYYG